MHCFNLILFLLLLAGPVNCRRSSEDESSSEEEEVKKAVEENPEDALLPSKEALEKVLLSFLDATIKRGQIEMAKSAFLTQLNVIKKIKPDQYEKYAKMGVDELAAEAVLKQADAAAAAPRSGNAFFDMLSDNGIPIGSSIKGVEDALRTQKTLENQDPSDQIAKAVFEKFQTQILPGIVANLVAGRNPFKLNRPMGQPPRTPTLRQPGGGPLPPTNQGTHVLSPAEEQQLLAQYSAAGRSIQRHPVSYRARTLYDEPEQEGLSLQERLQSSRRLSHLLSDQRISGLFSRRLRDDPVKEDRLLDPKSALLLGVFSEAPEDDAASKVHIERAPQSESSPVYTIRSSLLSHLVTNASVREALKRIPVRTDRVDELLRPAPFPFRTKNPQAGFVAPRPIPKRARKMLPLVIGVSAAELRRSPSALLPSGGSRRSRVIDNLLNNPNIAPLFMDGALERRLAGRQMLSDSQKGRMPLRVISTHPRFAAAHGLTKEDEKITQAVEQRPVAPLFPIGSGRHTRIRWTGARESEVPGVGGRFIIPSLDPTMPALNTAYSTQGRYRDEWDTMWNVPNQWQPGDEVRFSMKQKTQRFLGGDGNADMPAAGW